MKTEVLPRPSVETTLTRHARVPSAADSRDDRGSIAFARFRFVATPSLGRARPSSCARDRASRERWARRRRRCHRPPSPAVRDTRGRRRSGHRQTRGHELPQRRPRDEPPRGRLHRQGAAGVGHAARHRLRGRGAFSTPIGQDHLGDTAAGEERAHRVLAHGPVRRPARAQVLRRAERQETVQEDGHGARGHGQVAARRLEADEAGEGKVARRGDQVRLARCPRRVTGRRGRGGTIAAHVAHAAADG